MRQRRAKIKIKRKIPLKMALILFPWVMKRIIMMNSRKRPNMLRVSILIWDRES